MYIDDITFLRSSISRDIFIFTFCSVWLKPEVYERGDRDRDKLTSRGGWQPPIYRNVFERGIRGAHCKVNDDWILARATAFNRHQYTHTSEREGGGGRETANVIEKPRSFAREPPTKRIYRVCGFLLPTIINRESEFRLIRKLARARARIS